MNNTCSLLCRQMRHLDTKARKPYQEECQILIERELRHAICDGISVFRLGLDSGTSLWVGQSLLQLRDVYYPHIQIHCYLAAETQANCWQEDLRECYFDILAQSDKALTLAPHYKLESKRALVQTMLRGSKRFLLVHDQVAGGFFDGALLYAQNLGIEAHIIQLLEGPYVPFRLCKKPGVSSFVQSSKRHTRSTYSPKLSRGKSASKRA